MNKADLIKKTYLFRGIDASDLSALARIAEEKDLMAGNLIYDAGGGVFGFLDRRSVNRDGVFDVAGIAAGQRDHERQPAAVDSLDDDAVAPA